MRRKSEEFAASIGPYPEGEFKGKGIVTCGGGPRYLPGIYIQARALRQVGCKLPIEVWYLGRENEMPPEYQAVLEPFGVRCVDADEMRKTRPARRLNGWELKVYALLNTGFEESLFLDSDCYPVADPTFLFENPFYTSKGSMFWCDVPDDGRLIWPRFGASKDWSHGSIESGQLVLNKKKCWRELNLAWHYNDLSEYWYQYCYGDKHTFEAAWAKFGTDWYQPGPSQPRFDHHAFLHVAPDQTLLFIHRVCDKFKLRPSQFLTWQAGAENVFHPELPLEEDCFAWLSDLARALDYNRDVLNLCCRDSPMAGAVNHDVEPFRKFVEQAHDLGVTPWPWCDQSFIRVICKDGVEHFPDIVATMDEAWRVLKPGGLFSFSFPHPASDNAIIDPTHRVRLHPKTFEFFTNEGFGASNRFHAKRWKILRSETKEIPGGPDVLMEMEPVK